MAEFLATEDVAMERKGPAVDASTPVARSADSTRPSTRSSGAMVVGAVDDRAETDADAVADAVMAHLRRQPNDLLPGDGQRDHGGRIVRAADTTARRSVAAEGGVPDRIQRSSAPPLAAPVEATRVRRAPGRSALSDPAAGGELDDATSTRIRSASTGGDPLPGELGGAMEQAVGVSLADVRIHRGPEAADLNRAVSARAFTTGNHIFFGRGQYQPDSTEGQRLIAHEVGHVAQNSGGLGRSVQRLSNPDIIRRDDLYYEPEDSVYGADVYSNAYGAGSGLYALPDGADSDEEEHEDAEREEPQPADGGPQIGGGEPTYEVPELGDGAGPESGVVDRGPADMIFDADHFAAKKAKKRLKKAKKKYRRTLPMDQTRYGTESTVGSPHFHAALDKFESTLNLKTNTAGEPLTAEERTAAAYRAASRFGWTKADVDKYRDGSKDPVKYLNEQDRQDYEIGIGSSLTQGRDGRTFDTSAMTSYNFGAGYAAFVMSAGGDIYAGQHKVGLFHHSSFLAGANVAAAGELKVLGGKIVSITNKSGHYQTTAEALLDVLDVLKAGGVDLSQIMVYEHTDVKKEKGIPGDQFNGSFDTY